ncbi:MAG: carboxypeptidase regulatory-like domain-containing protein [Halioglobus sp.]
MLRTYAVRLLFVLSISFLVGSCGGNSSDRADEDAELGPRAEARIARIDSDLLQGPLARSSSGDFVLENDNLRVIIQKPGRNWFGLGTYGGNIIDASAKLADGSFNPDHMEEFVTGVNIENTPNYTDVEIRNDGDDREAAVICATGPDDLLEFVNASSAVRALPANFPVSADDTDLPLEIETCYSLNPEEPWVTIDTTLRNATDDAVAIYMTEYLAGSGEVEAFQPGAGFGEPLFTTSCPATTQVACSAGQCDQCNYFAYSGNGGASGVSYGLIHEEEGTSSFSTAGVSVLIYGQNVAVLIAASLPPNYEVPANGELTLRRYFAVGDGSASSIADIRNRIFDITTGEITGVVRSGGEPLQNADVAVFETTNAATNPPTLFVAGHARTDSQGRYSMTLPPGKYEVQAHAEGFLYADELAAVVIISEEQSSAQDFDLPAPGLLHVDVTEVFAVGAPEPSPAKLQLVGFDPSPELRTASTGVFGDSSDDLPFGIALVDFIDRDGSSDVLAVEPGEYQLVVSRGPRYSAFRQNITITSGQTTEVQAELTQVVFTPEVVYGDFHVHSIDSVDSEVTRRERVATFLAEGMDFFTPSDHGIRVDFTDTIMEMDVADLIGTAPSSELTTFDYGHFNSWPVTIDNSLIGGGNVDWGREAPPGMDFPQYGSFNLSPAEIYAQVLSDPMQNIVQINHIAGHFGPGGLAIDTGMTPPQSTANLSEKRLDPELENAFDSGFQSLEVWIGADGRSGIFDRFLGQNAGDWFNLINQGIVRTAVANSDTHDRRDTHLSTRNLISSAVTDPFELSGLASELAASVANGKVVGSNGPFMRVNAIGRLVGLSQTAGLGVDESTTIPITSNSTVLIDVFISTPEWAPVDSVDFYVNNQPELTTAPGEPARYGICPNFTVSAGDAGWDEIVVTDINGVSGASRSDILVTAQIDGVTSDSWVVAIAHGTDGVSRPMFPIVPDDLASAGNMSLSDLTDGNLDESGILAYAFSNPLFLDVGGNGWTAPGVANAQCSTP